MMQMHKDAVHTQLWCRISNHPLDEYAWWELPVQLTYRQSTPLEVSAYFVYDDIEWMLSRELLIRGFTHPIGIGDVRVHIPKLLTDGTLWYELELYDGNSPDGPTAHIRLPYIELYVFLSKTLELVPAGCEHVDIDALLQQLGVS